MTRIPIRLEPRAKYRNKRTDGFDSAREAAAFQNLHLLEKAGVIRDLKRQVRFLIEVNGPKICEYYADFTYVVVDGGKLVVEDAKGVRTPAYRLKKKLMKAIHGVDVKES